MQYALIRAARVENIIEADEAFAALIAHEWDAVEPLQALHEAGQAVGIGWAYAPPPEPEPPAEGEEPPAPLPSVPALPDVLATDAPAPPAAKCEHPPEPPRDALVTAVKQPA